MRKIPKFHLISWCGNFVEKHSFRIVSGAVRTAATSKYKLRSLALSESESLGKVYPFTYGAMLSPELIVAQLVLMAASPVGARIRSLALSGYPE